jgi:hypothetical protein
MQRWFLHVRRDFISDGLVPSYMLRELTEYSRMVSGKYSYHDWNVVRSLTMGLFGPFFLKIAMKSTCCFDMVCELLKHLTERKIGRVWFQHTAQVTVCEQQSLFGAHIILKGLPPLPPQFITIFFLGVAWNPLPNALTHAVWMNWKLAYQTSLLIFHLWCYRMSVNMLYFKHFEQSSC